MLLTTPKLTPPLVERLRSPKFEPAYIVVALSQSRNEYPPSPQQGRCVHCRLPPSHNCPPLSCEVPMIPTTAGMIEAPMPWKPVI